jgi:hypothetical protein
VDALRRAIHEADVDVSEVVLRELPRQPLESQHLPDGLRTELRDQLVEGAIPADVAFAPDPPEDLQRQDPGATTV